MNLLLQTCKCHWAGGEYLHWRRGPRRRPFAEPGTPPKFAADAPVTGSHMRLELHLDFQRERVWGSTAHKLRVLADEVREVTLQAVALEIGGVRVDGRRAVWENSGETLTIKLPRKAGRGDELEVSIEHEVTKPAAGFYFTNPDPAYPGRFQTGWSQGQDEDSRYYFPCLDYPNFKQTSEALIHVPAGFMALSNGELLSHVEVEEGGEALWHYKLELPYSTYLFSIVAGRFARHSEQRHQVEVRWFVQPGREREGRNAFGSTAKILRFFGELTGHPYPHRQYSQIAVPEFIFGGMENFTVTTQTDLTLHDDRAHLDFSSDDLVAHEAAHTWFGNMVTARSWAHAWLHESFATYLEALYQGHAKGDDERDYELLRNAETYFNEDDIYRRPLVTHRYEFPIDLFDAHLYPGGAVRLRHLHALLGERGFRALLHHFIEKHKYGLAETVDLARAVEKVSGRNYDWWFEQWILSAGYPVLELKFSWNEAEKVATVIIKQSRPLERSDGVKKPASWFRIPTRLLLQVGKERQLFPITIEGEESRFLFKLRRKPGMVLLDPDYECPVKKVTLKLPQAMLLEQLRRAPRPLSRIEAVAALADKPSQLVTRALGACLKREPFWGVQQRIAAVLKKIGGPTARDALLAAINLPHPKARRGVIAALGHFREEPKVARALERKAAKGDESYYVESELARAIGRCRTPRARELLEAFLQKPSHLESIRTGALDGLAELADPDSLPILAEAMRYGAPQSSRPAAIRAAGALGRRHQHLRKEVLELLRGPAEQREQPAAAFRAKLASIRAVGAMGDLDGMRLLRRVEGAEVDGRIRRLARETAKELRREADKPAEMEDIRTEVAEAVKENKSLRERVETLEKKPAAPAKKGRRQSKATG